jgi:DNA recombination protein RmuC
MTPETFIIGIVVALAAGAAIAALWMRGQKPEMPIDEATRPIAESIARLETQVRDLEGQRQRMIGGIEQQLSALGKETVALSRALRVPNIRGRWGELTLRRVAELSGMVPYCDFYEQQSGNGQRPDMLVKLPGGRVLAVDAKVPLAAFLDAEAATDDATRDGALARHSQQLSRHIQTLSTREYWAQFQPAPEMVVLFLAGDHFLSAALEREPDLLERALQRKVLIATPMTLISVLKGVSYGWRQEKLADNAEQIRRIGAEFYDRLRIFADTYVEVGRQLSRAVDSYNRSAGSWDTRVLPSLKRVQELGIGNADAPPTVAPIEGIVRDPKVDQGQSSIGPPQC